MKRVGIAEAEADEFGVDTRVHVHLDAWDKLRVFFGAPLVVWVETRVEKLSGRVLSSRSYVQVGGAQQSPSTWRAP